MCLCPTVQSFTCKQISHMARFHKSPVFWKHRLYLDAQSISHPPTCGNLSGIYRKLRLGDNSTLSRRACALTRADKTCEIPSGELRENNNVLHQHDRLPIMMQSSTILNLTYLKFGSADAFKKKCASHGLWDHASRGLITDLMTELITEFIQRIKHSKKLFASLHQSDFWDIYKTKSAVGLSNNV